jgi:hypothetical protein
MRHYRLVSSSWAALMITAVMPSHAKADLSSPDYVKAKSLYQSHSFDAAAVALDAYEASDSAWLSSHPDIKSQIDNVIKFCRSVEVYVGGVKATVIPPPLP